MADQERPGELFTAVYTPRGDALRDDRRMRRRLASLLRDVNHGPSVDIHGPITARLGIDVPFSVTNWDWVAFFERIDLGDVLDSITIIHAAFINNSPRSSTSARAAVAWLQGVQEIFDQQNVGYRIESGGGVRYRHDAALEAAHISAVGSLQVAGLAHIAALLEDGLRELDHSPPRFARGISGVFFAIEELFKLRCTGAPRLASFTIDEHLTPRLDRLTDANIAATHAGPRVIGSFKEWVAACHNYRHAAGAPEPQEPPLHLALLLVSQGISWIRWLADLTAVDSLLSSTPSPA